MSGLDHEKEFEAYLARRSGMHVGVSDGSGLEPPEELDRIVLTRARQAIRSPRPTRFYSSSRWALPMGLAATVVLTFTVMLHFGLLPQPVKQEVASLKATLGEQPQANLPPMSDAVTAAPAHPEANTEVPMLSPSADVRERDEAALSKSKSFEQLRAQRAIVAPASSRRAPEAAPPVLAQDSRASPIPSAPAGEAKASASGNLSGAIEAESRVEQAPPQSVKPADPAEWLKRIESLRTQGKTEEAEREWLAFRKAWPDYPVTGDANP